MNKRTAPHAEQKTPADYLPLTPAVFHILVALGDGESHGYAIMQDVLARTGGSVRLSAGTLYGAVSRLLGDGLIEESEERPDPEMDDTRRRYYRLSDLGSRVLAAETNRLTALIRSARATKAIRKMRPA
ncbi:MAG TPA: PadR family transcriptional regulator [Terriglobia bacterium]|nr:PadR family transcriptional regulator [Terriglobia bacterium]